MIGEILVEIMADEPGDGFRAPIALAGPFPSGAPAIFIDQVARMGQPCGIISKVGRDDVGRVNTDRLAADGVDVSVISINPDRQTGSAFVRYRADGSRDFVFNIGQSAFGTMPDSPAVAAMLKRRSSACDGNLIIQPGDHRLQSGRCPGRAGQGGRCPSIRTCARRSSTRRAWRR